MRAVLFCLFALLSFAPLAGAQPTGQPPPPRPPTSEAPSKLPPGQPEKGQPPPAQPPAAQSPAPGTTIPGGAAVQGTAPPPDAVQLLVFASDIGLILNPIKPDKTADFEMVMAKVREALLKSSNPVRQQQAANWKLLKAAETGPAASVLYVSMMQPPVPNADYTLSRILAEGFPTEVDVLWTKLRDAYAGPMHRLTLQFVVPGATPATTPAGEPKPATPEVKKPD